MSQLKAEVMSIGDELVTGQRLDTNTQWLSQRLGEIGIAVGFHTTIGDDLADHIAALKIAYDRADLVMMSGGLGPTADDLTREAIAQSAGVELEFVPEVLLRIEKIYRNRVREMPPSNRAQAYFPVGSTIVPNPEGTAPGIDLVVRRDGSRICRVIALPGVPAELKQMWFETLQPRLRELTAEESTIHHHTLHCFGLGESTIESMLPDLVRRGRDPQVGITASAATISLRVSTRGTSTADCMQKMQPTIDIIRDTLAELVFGENGQTLEAVVIAFLQARQQTLAIADAGTAGELVRLIDEGNSHGVLVGHRNQWTTADAMTEARTIKQEFGSDFGLAIGPLDHDEARISAGESYFNVALSGPQTEVEEVFRFGGHSGWRLQRAIKQALNLVRLNLQSRLPV